MKASESLNEFGGVRKIEGYDSYYRLKIGDYRLGLKLEGDALELIRFLHRRDIYPPGLKTPSFMAGHARLACGEIGAVRPLSEAGTLKAA